MIIPAILETTLENFNERIEQVKKLKPRSVQIDFADGLFVENKTISLAEVQALPEKISWEAHIMASDPQDFAPYKEKGFSKIIVHYESFENETALEDACTVIAQLDMTPAIAINPETPVSVLRYHADTINHFTLLSVHPGRQGQSLDEHIFTRVTELRDMAPEAVIEVDGGLNQENIKDILTAGANECAVGSAIFGGGNDFDQIKKQYQALNSLLK